MICLIASDSILSMQKNIDYRQNEDILLSYE